MHTAASISKVQVVENNPVYCKIEHSKWSLSLDTTHSTFLKVPKAYGGTQSSEILIKIWPMGYDSSGRGCYRETCGLGGSAEVLSQTGLLMWPDFAHLRGWCEVTRLDPTGTGWWWIQLLGQPWWGEAHSTGTRIHSSSSRLFPEVQTQRTHTDGSHTSFTILLINGSWNRVVKLPRVLKGIVKGFPAHWRYC